jgi:hypothetical protein
MAAMNCVDSPSRRSNDVFVRNDRNAGASAIRGVSAALGASLYTDVSSMERPIRNRPSTDWTGPPDARQNDRDAHFLWQRIDSLPEARCAIAGFCVVHTAARFRIVGRLGGSAAVPAISAVAIEREPPARAHQPGPKTCAVTQVAKAPVRFHQSLLRNIFRILLVPKHRERHAKSER